MSSADRKRATALSTAGALSAAANFGRFDVLPELVELLTQRRRGLADSTGQHQEAILRLSADLFPHRAQPMLSDQLLSIN